MAKGIREERELVQQLWKRGFAAIRAPASGAATQMPRPDIIAGSGERGVHLAIEVKTTHSDKLYIPRESVSQLIDFSKRFGCQPILAIKFKGRGAPWLFIEPQSLTTTAALNFKITLNETLQKGMDFKSLVRESKQTRLS